MNETFGEISNYCPLGMYYLRTDGTRTCRCIICARCGQHTGNNTQGHCWSWCRVTGDMRERHFCCPDACELETDSSHVTPPKENNP